MRYEKAALVLFAVLALAGCQTTAGTIHDVHTGVAISHSKRYQVQSGLLSSIYATAGHHSSKGYVVAVEYMATGGGWLFMEEAWSYGKRLPFEVKRQDVLACGAGCTLEETGQIRLTEDEFQTAASSGFAFKIVGRNGAIDGVVPASAFHEVLVQRGAQHTFQR